MPADALRQDDFTLPGTATGPEGSAGSLPAQRLPKFPGGGTFQAALRRRAEEYFRNTRQAPRGSPRLYAKAAVFFALFGLTYALLVFFALPWWLALPLAVALGLSMAGIGFNVMHDANHGAFSRFETVNRVLGWSLDLIGGSSFLWRLKHNVVHHTYSNLVGVDTSIDMGGLGRMTPFERWRPLHRWQHWYFWPLYCLSAIKWHLYDDFQQLATGRMGIYRFQRPRQGDLVVLIAGKALFFTLAFGLPLCLYPWWKVAVFYGLVAGSLGLALGVVTQVAHCVEPARFVAAAAGAPPLDRPWAVHQAESATNFACSSRLVTWLVGGLNFQIEHHLFPRVSHLHYPALRDMVRETCREFGVSYVAYRSFGAGVLAHWRWLRQMGRPDATP